MRRLLSILLATALLAVAALTLFGGAGHGAGPIIIVVPLGVAALGVARLRRTDRVGEFAWHESPRDMPTDRRAGDAAPASPPKPPATRRQVAAALARVETREWLASPWFATGVGFCILLTVLFGWVFASDSDGAGQAWRTWFVLFPIMAHPMVGMVVVGAHHAVTRGRRDGAEELFLACPTDEATRTAGHVRSSWVPAAVVATFVLAATVLHADRLHRMYGPIDARAVADCLAAVVLALCGAGLGIALARWAPWRLVPVVFVVALLPIIQGLGDIGDPHWSNTRQLSTWPRYPDHDLLFTAPPVWWHLLWLAGLGALMVVVALAHAGRGRGVALTGLAVAVVVAGAGIAETRPLSPAAAGRLASLIAEPAQHQTCRSPARVEVCVYRGYERYLDVALARVAPVAAAAPDTTRPARFRQFFEGDLKLLGPEVARALRGRAVAGRAADSDGYLPLGFKTGDGPMTALRITTALHAVGLPVRAQTGDVPTVIAGEARGVVALWLAARGLVPRDARRLASYHFYNPANDPRRTPTALDFGMAWPDPCDSGPPPVVWAAQDLTAARELLALPERSVHRLLLGDWTRFTDPATRTDELLATAGLAPIGAPDHLDAVPVPCTG